jgi:hypothetical protein
MMPVDEKELGKTILAKGSILLPASHLFIAYYIFSGNQWFIAPSAVALAAAYQIWNWDGRHLLAWGVGALLLAGFTQEWSQWTANSIAIDGYWLCFAGLARMGSELALGLIAGKKGRAGDGARIAPAHKKKTRSHDIRGDGNGGRSSG